MLITLFLGGSLSQVWSMVNSLQLLGGLALFPVMMPAIVYKIMRYLATISGFELLPPEDIISHMLSEGFTET
jgi:hypothetical protein